MIFSLILHVDVVCADFKLFGFDTQTIFSRESFIKTRAIVEDVIEGWRPKVEG